MDYITLFWLGLPYAFAFTLGITFAVVFIEALIELLVRYVYSKPQLHFFFLPWYQFLLNPSRPRRRTPRFQSKAPAGRSKSYMTDPKNRQLQHLLLGMLQGDAATAKRLLKRQRQRYPGQTDNWYLEKVIHDLERDRH